MKGANFKTFLLNHGEKIGFGLLACIALWTLVGTSWSGYERTPAQLIDAAQKGKQALDASKWPEEEKQKLTDWESIVTRSHAMLTGINAEEYALTTEFFVPIYKRSEPILEPKFFTADDLRAKPGRMVLELRAPDSEDPLVAELEKSKDQKADDANIPEAFRERAKPAATADSGYNIGILLDETQSAMPTEYMSDMAGEMAGNRTKQYGQGFPFVAVRGIIDLQAQKAAYAAAMHMPQSEIAQIEPYIIGFEIERQRAVSGPDRWSGKWEKLDIQNSMDVLLKAANFEVELIDPTLTDPAITEPLPTRLFGQYGPEATHEKVEKFKLSEEEIAKENARIQRLIELNEAMARQGGMTNERPVQKGGFANVVHDVRGMESTMNQMIRPGSANNPYTEMYNQYNQEYTNDVTSMYPGATTPGRPGPARPGMAQDSLLAGKRSPASGRLLLFRYFDFDVEPGEAYRYRVRIEYANPNFGRRIDTLAQPEFQEGQTRFSDWSEVSMAEPSAEAMVLAKAGENVPLSADGAIVPKESEFYLSQVDKARNADSLLAAIDLFQWSRQFGSEVNQSLQLGVGDAIGVSAKTKVVDLIERTYEVKQVNILTDNFLLDLVDNSATAIDATLPGLDSIPKTARLDLAVVVDKLGRVSTLDPVSQNPDLRNARQRVSLYESQGKKYEEETKKADEATLDSLYGSEYMGAMDAGRKPTNAASKRNRRSTATGP